MNIVLTNIWLPRYLVMAIDINVFGKTLYHHTGVTIYAYDNNVISLSYHYTWKNIL